jgi:uncharacterized protein (DUF488 family)
MKTIATIGYEGATMPRFLDALRGGKVELVVDVRAVTSSRRPGFSKSALAAHLGEIGVDYLHLRGLGTPADGRAAAKSGRFDELREIYTRHLETTDAQVDLQSLADLVRGGRRACLLCYEADPAHCHRIMVAEALAELVPVKVEHLAPSAE